MSIDPAQIRRIAEAIAKELAAPPSLSSGGGAGPQATTAPAPAPRQGDGGIGVFETVDQCVDAANVAFEQLDSLGLEQRMRIVAAMRRAALPQAESLARLAVDETKLGRYEDKVKKNILVTEKTPGPESLFPEARSGDRGLMLVEPAPWGVIGAITPTTNPSSTIINNAIAMVSAGNSVVFNVHPSAIRTSMASVDLLNQAIVSAGGPPNVLCTVGKPTIQSAQALMKHERTRITVVTGGAGVVQAALSAGKRAICAGPGNPPAVVDATADLEQAARNIVMGHSFDNNIICVDEKEVVVVDKVADALKAAMRRNGAYELDRREIGRLEQVIFKEGAGPRGHAVLRREMVGKDASVILAELGIKVGSEVRTILIEVDPDHPLMWTEQMMPVLPLARVPDVNAAIDYAVEVEGYNRHTFTMHSHDIAALSKMARRCAASVFVKNGMSVSGLGYNATGFSSFTIASPTGEGLTGPLSFSRLRRCTVMDHFRIV